MSNVAEDSSIFSFQVFSKSSVKEAFHLISLFFFLLLWNKGVFKYMILCFEEEEGLTM